MVFITSGPSVAQKPTENLPLHTVLVNLEEKYSVSFTYADETITGISLIPPADSLGLTETLAYLHQQTSLIFRQLDDRFITISKPVPELINICGYIIDDEDQTAIVGAILKIGNKFIITNDEGYFSVKAVPADSAIQVKMLGYEPLAFPANRAYSEKGCRTFPLSPKATRLQEVMISNIITTGIDKQLNGVYVVNADKLGILPGLTEPDILHAIQVLPGIQSINETVSDINVRGGTNDQNLVLWDGIKMYQTGHFFGLISAFNPYLNKEVKIIKNGASAFYSDAVSSIINISSDNSLTPEFTGGAGINMINADAYFKIPLTSKITLQLSGRRSITDLIKTPVFNNYFERAFRNTDVTKNISAGSDTLFNSDENFFFYDVGVNLIYNASGKDKLRIHFLTNANDLEYLENIKSPTFSDSKTSSLTQSNIAGSIYYQRLWHNKLSTTALMYISSYALRTVNFDILNNQRLTQENDVLDNGIKLDARWQFNPGWDLFSGYQFQEMGVGNLEEINNPEFKRYIKRVIRTHVAFAEINYQSKSGKTNARFGFRANYFPKFNRVIPEPRLAFDQQVGEFFTIEVLGEFRSQAATQVIDLQNDFLGVEKRRWVLANEDDNPLVLSKQVSTGLHFNKNKLLISLEGFYKFVDGITSSSQGFQNQFQNIKAKGSYTISGIELLVNKQFNHVSLWASYAYTDNQYKFPTFTPSVFANNLDIRHTASFGVNIAVKRLELSGGLNWRTGKPYTLPAGVDKNQIVYQSPNSARLPDYLRVDFSAKYNFKLSAKIRAQAGGSIWNLINYQNVFNIYYQLDTNHNIREIRQYALSFTPNLMFRVYF